MAKWLARWQFRLGLWLVWLMPNTGILDPEPRASLFVAADGDTLRVQFSHHPQSVADYQLLLEMLKSATILLVNQAKELEREQQRKKLILGAE